jgi:perosamine synthetase
MTDRRRLPYGHQFVGAADIEAVSGALRDDWITQGPRVADFERAIAEYCGAPHAVAFSSGTAALHGACAAAGLGPGDEAVTSPLTFAATANAVVYCGARPVFADIDAASLNIDPTEIARRLSPRTKAVLPVDFAGLPADLDAIGPLARDRGLVVIEDAAHALGAEVKVKGAWERVGSAGVADMVVFSFHPVKHITTGEGGMVLTRSAELAERMRSFRHHGIRRDATLAERHGPWYYEIDELGFNYRLTDFQCALGLSQMQQLSAFVQRRTLIAERYRRELSGRGLGVQEWDAKRFKHAWHLFTIQLPLRRLRGTRREIFDALTETGVGVQVHYIPVYYHPFYQRLGYRHGECPVAESYYDSALTLPLFPSMTDDDVTRVIDTVSTVLKEHLVA